MRGVYLEHHPFLTLNDETEITYSDIKKDIFDNEYIDIYFETPSELFCFCNMHIKYPGDIICKCFGYTEQEKENLLYYYNKTKELMFKFAKEDSNGYYILYNLTQVLFLI